jgi:hypothetical protein
VHSLDDVDVAIAVDVEQERHLAVNLGDVALEDTLGENGRAGLFLYIVYELLVGDSDTKFDNIQMACGELLRAVSRQVDICVVRENTILLQTLAFSADRSNVDPRCFPDSVIRLARVANQMADYRLFLLI